VYALRLPVKEMLRKNRPKQVMTEKEEEEK